MRIVRIAALAFAALIMFATAFPIFAQSLPVEDRTISVNGQIFRYLAAGTKGQPIILLHGWPQSADEFRKIISLLAENHQVYAPDLSGVGGTSAPRQDWRKEALALDVKQFVDNMKLEKPVIVGHDIGGMVAYAYARLYPGALRGVAILDVPIPGLAPWDSVASSQHAWHFAFHNQKGLAEKLVAGRQAEYFRYFFDRNGANPKAILESDIAVFAKAYGTPDRLRAGFEFYRAFDEDAKFFISRNEPLDVPMLVMGGEDSMKSSLAVMAKSFAAVGVAHVRTIAIAGAGHWLAEEQPEETAAAILKFVSGLDAQ